MFRQVIIIIFVITLAGFNSSARVFYPKSKVHVYIKKALKIKEVEILDEIEIAEELISENAIAIYTFKQANSKETQYAIFSEAKGRHEKFDFLLIVNAEYCIKKAKVLKYRSENGGEIASKRWLTQFEDYSGGPLKYGKEISAISGATVSAKSITDCIPKVLKVLKVSCL